MGFGTCFTPQYSLPPLPTAPTWSSDLETPLPIPTIWQAPTVTPDMEVIPNSDFMANNNGLHMFWGNGEIDGENVQDFINGIEHSILAKANLSEVDKVCTFELWLKSGRAAKIWWNRLAAGEKDNWAHLRVAFKKSGQRTALDATFLYQ